MSDIFKPLVEAKKVEASFEGWEIKDDKHHQQPSSNEQTEEEKEILLDLENEARKRGYADGLKQAEQEIDTLKSSLLSKLSSLDQPMHLLNQKVKQLLCQLIVEICKQVLNSELALDRKKLMSVIDEIIPFLPLSKKNVQVSMSPSDLKYYHEIFHSNEGPFAKAAFVEDSSLSSGEFYIQSTDVDIDTTIQARLKHIIERLYHLEGTQD